MVQSGVQIKPFKLTKTKPVSLVKLHKKCTLSVMDPEAKSTAGWDGVVYQSPRYISGGNAVGLRD